MQQREDSLNPFSQVNDSNLTPIVLIGLLKNVLIPLVRSMIQIYVVRVIQFWEGRDVLIPLVRSMIQISSKS